MRLSRLISAMTVGALMLTLAACGSGGGKTEFKLAFNQTEEHPQYAAGVEFGRLLEEATEGRYSIKVYPNEQLGGQADVIQNLSDGTVEMMWVGGPVLESYNKDFVVFNLPYVFDSVAAQGAILSDTELLGDLYTSIEQSNQITVLAGVHAGVRNVYNSRHAVRTPDDLKGLKIRVQQSDSQVKMIEAMGAVAAPLNNGEVYAALQGGVLDGAENNEVTWDALKQSEIAKYYSYTRHLMIPDYLLISTKALNAMPDKDREALLELVPQVQQVANDGFAAFTEKSIANATSIGCEFNDDVDVDAFKARVEPLVEAAVNENEVRKALHAAIQEANQAHPAK